MSLSTRRLKKEWALLKQWIEKHPVVILLDDEPKQTQHDNQGDWEEFAVLIRGPKGTYYEQGAFHISIKRCRSDWQRWPSLQFSPGLIHPNIRCGSPMPPYWMYWGAAATYVTLMKVLFTVLQYPNPDDPEVPDIGRRFKQGEAITATVDGIKEHNLDKKLLLFSQKTKYSGIHDFNLHALPKDVVKYILSMLPLYDLVPLSRVSKEWHEIIMNSNLWKSFDLDSHLSFLCSCQSFWVFLMKMDEREALPPAKRPIEHQAHSIIKVLVQNKQMVKSHFPLAQIKENMLSGFWTYYLGRRREIEEFAL